MDDMRKAFEAHCARNWIDVDRVMDGPYKDASTQRAWEAWVAASHRAVRLILDDASAITYQTMGQYRTAMAKAIAA